MTQHALITGGANGLGLALAKLLASHKWHVFAGDCDQQALDNLQAETNITPLFLDVTDNNSIQAAVQSVQAKTPKLDAIVNFAGILRVGPIIEMDEAVLSQVLNINLLGTFRINKAFFDLIRTNEGPQGRIINISSETGWHTASPFNGPYAMSKYGIEAYSDTLRRELSIYNIPVICVQPGPFKTALVANTVDGFNQASEQSQLYKAPLKKFGELVFDANKKAGEPEVLADVIYTALTVKKPKHRYSVKADFGRSLLEYLPMSWGDTLFRKILDGA